MLEIIKQTIENVPDDTFNLFFAKYVLEVQDANIDAEIRGMLSRNKIDVAAIELVIQDTYDKLVKL